jgi:hypothetical protein
MTIDVNRVCDTHLCASSVGMVQEAELMVAEQPSSVQCLQQRLVKLLLLCQLRSKDVVPEACMSPV